MQKNIITYVVAGILTLLAGTVTRAQTYSNTVMGLNPVGYWPLTEATQPPQPLNLVATNLGSLGAAGNGYYGAWYQPSGNTWYLTNNIVQTNAVTFPFDGSKAMECQRLPGQYVIVPRNTNGVANTGVTLNPPFSIEVWLQIGATNSALGDIISEGGTVNLNTGGANTNNPFYGGLGTGWAGVELGQYQDYLFLLCQSTKAAGDKSSELDTSGYNQDKGFEVGQWVHVVAEFDGTTESIYTNGVLAASKTVSPNSAGQTYVADPTTPLMIGSGSEVTADYGIAYQGGIDDVAIYTNILSTTSIQNHFQTAYGTNATFGANYPSAVLADNPVLYYRLNDPQVQTNAGYNSASFPVANNYGSAGAAGNGVYQPGTTPGLAGPSYSGFGANSRGVGINGWLGAVDVGNSNLPVSLNPTGAVPMSVVSWFKTAPADAPGRFQEILGHGDSSYRLALGQTAGENHFNPGPGPELQFANPADVATNGFAFNDGQWHMVAGVSDGTNEYLYLDGVLAKSSNNPAGINIAGNPADLLLGGDSQYTVANAFSANTVRNFDGDIAQVAFWTNALTAAQIQSLFNAASAPPYFWLQPVSQTNNAGANVTIIAGVRGSAPVSFQWYHYPGNTQVSGQTNENLNFNPASTGNAGNYYLVAANGSGSVTSAVVNLVLYGPPTISSQTPTQIQIFAGASPTLRIAANGAQPLTYYWTSNGVPVVGQNSSNLVVSDVQASATFGCTVSNFVGTAPISTISMTVLADPTAPYPRQVLANGPIAYWRLDEASGATAYDYAGGNNGTYTNVTLGKPGYNSGATIKSDPSETAAEFGDVPPNDYAGNVPSYFNFGTPSGGNAEFTVEAWFNELLYNATSGNAIVALGTGNGGEEFVLDTGATAAGDLRFLVRNAAGTPIAANSTYAPANDGLWHHVVGVCDEANGTISLYMDGVLVGSSTITAGSGLLGATAPLSIGSRQSANNGGTNYDAQFYGSIDDVAIYNYAMTPSQVSADFYASGIAPVVTQISPTNQVAANQGGNVSVSVAAAGTTPFTYQWRDNNNNVISYATGATLNLTNVQTTQAGTYTVTVGNSYGSGSTNFSLSVGSGPPTIAVDLSPINLMAYAGTLETYSIHAGGSGEGLAYQWYRDGSAIPGATSSSYTFTVIAGTNTYFCAVTNDFSAGVPTDSSTGTVIGIVPPSLNPTSYSSKTKITFVGYNRGETLQDFPALVELGPTNISGFSYSQFASPTGGDLRFTDSTGSNEIPYEIDEWNPTGVSTIWVQVPNLSSNSIIWAYWGNTNTTPPASTTNGAVWVPPVFESLPSYEVVYHMEQTNYPYLDSTLQYPSTNGVAPVSAAGIVGGAASFSGGAYLDAGDINLGNTFTLSAWINLNPTASNIQGVWVNGPGGYTSDEIALFVNDYNTADGALLLGTGDGTAGQQPETATNLVTTGQWHLLTAAVNRPAGTTQLYVDGNLQASGNTVTDFPTNSDMNLGRFNAGAFALNGLIDEARIHTGVDDANWTWASYETVAQNSLFETYSAVGAVTLAIQRSGNQVVLTWSSGTLQSASSVSGPYSNVVGVTSPYTNSISGVTTQFYRVRVQ